MKSMAIAALLFALVGAAHGATPRGQQFWVSPTATAGDGTQSKPWGVLQMAEQRVPPGSTVWIMDGVYPIFERPLAMKFAGTASKQTVIRAAPGAHPVWRGHVRLTKSYITLQGLEIHGSDARRQSSQAVSWTPRNLKGGGVDIGANDSVNPPVNTRGIKLINNVIHDVNNNCIGAWKGSQGTEIYGNIVYYCGWYGPKRAHGHGIYTQNVPTDPIKTAKRNISFKTFMYGIQCYGSGYKCDNYDLIENTLFLAGNASGENQFNFIAGGGISSSNINMIGNLIYAVGGSVGSVGNSFSKKPNGPWVFNNNRFASNGLLRFFHQAAMTQSGNILWGVSPADTPPPGLALTAVPTSGLDVFVQDNAHDPNRWQIIIYNWARTPTASVSLPLSAGAKYEIRDVENYRAVLIAGTYTGSPVAIPMTGPVDPGIGLRAPPVHSSTQFGAFILTKP